MAEIYADPDFVLIRALRERLPPDVEVAAVADVDTPLHRETVLVRAVTGRPAANADPRAAGIWTVSVMVIGRDLEEAQALTGSTFGTIVDLEQTHVPEAGFVSTVDSEMLPTRSTTSEVANSSKTFHQFNMQFTVRLRPYST